jgi:hypothetical protein
MLDKTEQAEGVAGKGTTPINIGVREQGSLTMAWFKLPRQYSREVCV